MLREARKNDSVLREAIKRLCAKETCTKGSDVKKKKKKILY